MASARNITPATIEPTTMPEVETVEPIAVEEGPATAVNGPKSCLKPKLSKSAKRRRRANPLRGPWGERYDRRPRLVFSPDAKTSDGGRPPGITRRRIPRLFDSFDVDAVKALARHLDRFNFTLRAKLAERLGAGDPRSWSDLVSIHDDLLAERDAKEAEDRVISDEILVWEEFNRYLRGGPPRPDINGFNFATHASGNRRFYQGSLGDSRTLDSRWWFANDMSARYPLMHPSSAECPPGVPPGPPPPPPSPSSSPLLARWGGSTAISAVTFPPRARIRSHSQPPTGITEPESTMTLEEINDAYDRANLAYLVRKQLTLDQL